MNLSLSVGAFARHAVADGDGSPFAYRALLADAGTCE